MSQVIVFCICEDGVERTEVCKDESQALAYAAGFGDGGGCYGAGWCEGVLSTDTERLDEIKQFEPDVYAHIQRILAAKS